MEDYRFTLEKYKPGSKYLCPRCEKKTFKRYIDKNDGEYLHADVGRCDREVKCAYHYKPADYFSDGGKIPEGEYKPKPIIEKPPSYIDFQYVNKSMRSYNINDFVKYLYSLSDKQNVNRVIQLYRIGTSKKFKGSTVFWQIDSYGKVRHGKIVKYKQDGHRTKFFTTVGSELGLKEPEFNRVQCFFGEHLINSNDIIHVVEAEKTAAIASLFLPEYTWISTGGKTSGWSNPRFFKCLEGKRVILYPDTDAVDDWLKQAERVKHLADITINNFLSDFDLKKGSDIADLLTDFSVTPPVISKQENSIEEELRSPSSGLLTISDIKIAISKYGCKGLNIDERNYLEKYLNNKNPAYKELVDRFQLDYL